ncbi:bifunctional preprotein translocase subunit SecD/SecF [Blattabacterium sp. (Blattella germanica) str. Bge]|uniref:protein translocase subunit SecD n=1 Tax=Blattabacterium sp. (Blattella germanica) TaxID=624186 RepID=UPI0001BB60B5|nr:protein translocase subunit SecD [Blattabacterium sp. (Blattella germanica)]ACY40127.1 bifunctional preprotein translocase subunit SecD/SecF [Blattabacterium sp. (Blattella germanica) str. Bge]
MRIGSFFTIFTTIILTIICLYYIHSSVFKKNNKKTLNLGLDLEGGISIILDVSEKYLLKKFSENSQNPFFIKALEYADQKKKENPNADYLSFFINFFDQLNIHLSSPDLFGNRFNIEKIDSNSSNVEIKTFLKEKIELSIISIQNILRSRIDQFGVLQPNIQRIKNSNRILIELSGIKDVDRIKNILEKKAELHFFETYNFQEVFPYFKKIDKFFHKKLNKSFIDVLNISTRKSNNIVGFIHKKHKKVISEFLNSIEATEALPYNLHNVKFLWGNSINNNFLQLFAVKINNEETYSYLNGDVVTRAYKSFGPFNEISVNIKMNQEGTKKWKIFTEKNIGKNIAIVLDDFVYANPLVQSVITNGMSQISGHFSIQESNDLVNVLNAGELPTSVNIVQTEIVGPSLGKESIHKGMKSFLIALFFVFFWMIFHYSIPGLYSDIILIFNIIFIFGILISINAVLTFPGIAGIILTLAMSMDANILIYEKIKENIRNKISIFTSIHNSYTFQGALSSIIDGQITTLLCGIILFYFGTGPIQGFSTTLIIGIIISVFTSTCLGRLLLEWHLKKYQNITFGNKMFINVFHKIQNIQWDFLSKRKWYYMISSILLIISVFSMVFKGLNLGLDFVGGRSYVILFDRKMIPEKISEILSKTFLEKGRPSFPNVKTFGNENQLKIVTKYKIWEENHKIDEEILQKMFISLKDYFPIHFHFRDFKNIEKDKPLGVLSSEKVEPTIAKDMKDKSFISIIISLIGIFLYIFIRFQKWQFGLGAVVSLIHDSVIVLGIYSFFYGKFPILEIDQSFIAALLTIIGYSINDTVIVYDQIRKISKKTSSSTMKQTINTGIVNSLTRTINTSLITLLVISIIFLFGGAPLRSFMLALFLGVSIGTYSSIFIAPSIVYDFCKKI